MVQEAESRMDGSAPGPEENIDLPQMVGRWNESLRLGGADNAEQAFGLGCSLGVLPIVVILLLLLVFKVINVILAFILLVMSLLALVGVVMLAAQQARQSGIRRRYRTEVEGEIDRYLAESRLSRSQFHALILTLMPEDAPLQAFLTRKDSP
jgi:hypothetical protein